MRHSLASLALATVLAAAPLLTGCGKDDPKGHKIDMTSGTQRSAIENLAKKGTAHLKDMLKSTHQQVRMDATSALGFVRDDPEATKLLIKLIEGDSEDDAVNAIIAIGVQGVPEAKELLQKHIKDPRWKVRGGAVFGIAEYGDSTLYPLLDEVAVDDPDPRIRKVAARVRQQIETGRNVPFAHKTR